MLQKPEEIRDKPGRELPAEQQQRVLRRGEGPQETGPTHKANIASNRPKKTSARELRSELFCWLAVIETNNLE